MGIGLRKSSVSVALVVLISACLTACGQSHHSSSRPTKDTVDTNNKTPAPFASGTSPSSTTAPVASPTPQSTSGSQSSPQISSQTPVFPTLPNITPTTNPPLSIVSDYWADCQQGVYIVVWSNGSSIPWPVEVPPGTVTITTNAQTGASPDGNALLPTPLTLSYTTGAEYVASWQSLDFTGAYEDASCSP
jgi:hypothetical protein